MRENPFITIGKIANVLITNRIAVMRHIDTLKSEGELSVVGLITVANGLLRIRIRSLEDNYETRG